MGEILKADAIPVVLFLHDLSVSESLQGLGLGRRLVDQALDLARHDGLKSAELIAVDGAARYWQRLGFAEEAPSATLAAEVAGYGADARWMTRAIM